MNNKVNYGTQLGREIREGLKGLNTCASPKSKKTCEKLIIFPFLTFVITVFIIGITNAKGILSTIAVIPFMLSVVSMGAYQFYLGKFKKGIIYTLTCGMFFIGMLVDLFKLKITHTLCDSNGFPLIY